ncbi:MAG: glycosyltransferase [Oscillospiraceae bacterium]|nr:glycosyltransferase [Oscillospiraceae bacterium]
MKKVKVVFVHYKMVCGGAEQALYDLINLMDKEKFDVSLYLQCPGGEWDSRFYGKVPVYYDFSCRIPTKNPVKKLGNLVKKHRIAQAYKNEGEGLLDVIFPEGVDIVVSNSTWDYDRLPFAKNTRNVKYIHGDPGTDPVYREEAEDKKDLLKRYHRIVCVSRAALEHFHEINSVHKGVELHYNPIDSDHVRELAQQPVDLPTDVPLICAVGRLCEDKGFVRLLVIHKRLLDEGIRHNLVIVGDGPDRDFLRRLVNALGVQDSVILAGYQSNPYPYMKQSKFVVSSSFIEGLPVISMEALSLGVPMVSAVPSIGEVFGDEMCGLITENDNESLMEGIRRMLTDNALYAKAKAGAEKRSAFFDGKRMVKEIEDMFLEMMQEE